MSRSTPPPRRPQRPSRRIHDESPGDAPKLREIAECPECHASYRNGRWTWEAAPVGAYEHECPACERIRTDYPGGIVRLEGAFAAAHRDELVGLVHNVEERERSEHPLSRVMSIDEEDGALQVKTTEARLAEAVGRAVHSAYEGDLEMPPTSGDKQNLARVRWSRD